jgi:outer membrane lipoprotein LolB
VNRPLAAVAVLLCAGGCATLPTPPPVPDDDWPARVAALQSLDAWTLKGRLGVAAGEKGFSGGLAWTQAGDQAEVVLSGPMGGEALAIRVEGTALSVTLRGETYAGDEAQRLIEERIGAGRALPVAELRYWLVGAPAPELPYEKTLGEDRRLASLAQSGWQIRYPAYRVADGPGLPARIEMTTEGLRLRVVASGWELPP